jgi:hypothetical protein
VKISRRSFAAVTLAGILVLSPSPARAQALNVKLGLWEVTWTVQTAGLPPIDTSKMTPEQRARVEAAMKLRATTPTTRTRRDCMTKEKLEKEPFQEKALDPSCKRTILSNTPSLREFTIECTGDQATSGRMRFEALSPENVKGTTRMSIVRGGSQMTADTTLAAKWIGASCGDVK